MPGALSKRFTFDDYVPPTVPGWPPQRPDRRPHELPAHRTVTRAGDALRRHSIETGTKASTRTQLRDHANRVLDEWQAHLDRRHVPHDVYQLHDARGRLLYVGATNDPAERLRWHAKRQPWWDQVAHRTIETHPNRDAAIVRQRDLIVRHAPLHNRSQPRPEPPIVLAARAYLAHTR